MGLNALNGERLLFFAPPLHGLACRHRRSSRVEPQEAKVGTIIDGRRLDELCGSLHRVHLPTIRSIIRCTDVTTALVDARHAGGLGRHEHRERSRWWWLASALRANAATQIGCS